MSPSAESTALNNGQPHKAAAQADFDPSRSRPPNPGGAVQNRLHFWIMVAAVVGVVGGYALVGFSFARIAADLVIKKLAEIAFRRAVAAPSARFPTPLAGESALG